MSSLQAVMLPWLLLSAASASPAADPDFEAVVRGIESHFHTERTRLPMMGLVKFVVRVSRPDGVKQLDLAIFENLPVADDDELDQVVRQAVGGRWSPMVTVRSRRDGENTFIYARESGKNWTLLLATFERDEATVVKLKIDAKTLARMLAEPTEMGHTLRAGEDR